MKDGNGSPHRNLMQLLRQLGMQIALLARKEVELVRAETGAGVKAQITMMIFLIIAAGCGFLALLTLVATAIIALQYIMPLWLSGVIVSAILLLTGLILAFIGLKKSVKSPWVRTREVIRSDIRMAKGGLV